MPEGMLGAPYAVLDFEATLVLHDTRGAVATFRRTEHVQLEQDRVSTILDSFWGDGVMLTSYQHSAGSIEESFRDAGYRHVVIGLNRKMQRGDQLRFTVERQAMEAFLQEHEWVETTLARPTKKLRRSIIFPKGRPCRVATLHHKGRELPLTIRPLPGGKTLVTFQVDNPEILTPYTVTWTW
jgi:hypothetical protein